MLGVQMSEVSETLASQSERQHEKLKQLKARKQAAENRQKAKVKEQERRDDTRRKILVGAEVLKRGKNHPDQHAKIIAMMDDCLIRDDDRLLFGLPAKRDS